MLKDPYEYFPGDPPISDLVFPLAVMAGCAWGAVATARVFWKLHRRVDPSRVRRFAILSLLIAFAVPALAAVPLALRHVGPMGRLKAKLQSLEQESRSIRETTPGASDQAIVAEFERRYPDGLEFRMTPEHLPVRITVTGLSPAPQLKVHFGHGGDAIFDTTTMACVYSD